MSVDKEYRDVIELYLFTFVFTFFISRVGALTGKVTRTVAAIANHFDTAAGGRAFKGLARISIWNVDHK